METCPDVDVTSWEVVRDEPMGEPGKVWLEDPEEQAPRARWLFKPVRLQQDPRGPFRLGEDWAEKIAADLAACIGLPAARVELASRGGRAGALSLDIARGRQLSLGNELLSAQDPSYPFDKVGTVPEYTLDRILDALIQANIHAPARLLDDPNQDAGSLFAGFLLLDAWVANQDRHHGNWGVLEDLIGGSPSVLAPSFDHGSSLGFQLHEDHKRDLLSGGGFDGWTRRGFCRPMGGRPNLVELALEATRRAATPGAYWLERLSSVTAEDETSIVDAVPDGRMSHLDRMFATAVLERNRRRLLGGT